MYNVKRILAVLMLAGCGSGGGGEEAPAPQPAPRSIGQPNVEPDILTVTNQGLQRGKTNGQEQRLIFAQPNMHYSSTTIGSGYVLYTKTHDVWAVRGDGTGDRAIVNTPESEFIVAVNGPWLIYGQDTVQPSGRLFTRYGSANNDCSYCRGEIGDYGYRLSGSRA